MTDGPTLQASREIAYRVYHGTSRGGERLVVTFGNGRATVNLEPAINASSPLTMNADALRRMADALDAVQELYEDDQRRGREFDAWLLRHA